MSDFFFGLPAVVQALVKGLAVILFIFPVAAACSMAERKVSRLDPAPAGPEPDEHPRSLSGSPGSGSCSAWACSS